MSHYVLAERIEGYGASCARRGKGGEEKDRKTGEESGHQAGKHRDPLAVNHEDQSALQKNTPTSESGKAAWKAKGVRGEGR